MKIYVLTSGVYSDYHIITATTDKKLAYELQEKFNKYEQSANGMFYDMYKVNVEEYENAERYTEPCYRMIFDKKGNVIECEKTDDEYDYDEFCFKNVNGNVNVSVVADTKEKA
ncbi:MAG: hypothetical protein IKJ01_05120, partial [Lachnospiraceae bacterium]|nr:hypothetical protein [Lachnospiraceae bacterium]